MNCTVDGITDELHRLVSKLEKRESTLDAMRELILDPVGNQYRCQEDLLSFEEFCKCVGNHPRGWLILSLAAENKELEQLQLENRTLLESLNKHQSALELILKKYRLQVLQLMRTKRMEDLINSSNPNNERQVVGLSETHHSEPINSSSEDGLVRAEPISSVACSDDPELTSSKLTQALLTAHVSTIASMVQEVCDRGDAYTSQLETELNRLRLENAGLREMLVISSDSTLDTTDLGENNLSTDHNDLGSTSMQSALRSGLSVRPPKRKSRKVASKPIYYSWDLTPYLEDPDSKDEAEDDIPPTEDIELDELCDT